MKFVILFIIAILCSLSLKEHYLSDNDEQYKCIENIQKNYAAENLYLSKIPKNQFTESSARTFLINNSKQVQSFSFDKDSAVHNTIIELFDIYLKGKYPTRYQDPFSYLIYAPIVEEIDNSAKVLFPNNDYIPKYGTLYINGIGAERFPCNNGYLLLINLKFPIFCHQMGKVALQPFNVEDHENGMMTIRMDTNTIIKNITQDNEIEINFLYTFLELQMSKFPQNDKLFLNNSYFEKALQYWNNSSEIFVIGHEYAHGMLKHKYLNTGSDYAKLSSWYDEVNADAAAQNILSKIMLDKKQDSFYHGWIKYLTMGGEFFLNNLEVYEKGKYIFDNGIDYPSYSPKEQQLMLDILTHQKDPDNLKKFKTLNSGIAAFDHPPASIRKILLRQQLESLESDRIFEKEDFNLVENFHLELANKMNFGINYMFYNSKFAFKNAHIIKDSLFKMYDVNH